MCVQVHVHAPIGALAHWRMKLLAVVHDNNNKK